MLKYLNTLLKYYTFRDTLSLKINTMSLLTKEKGAKLPKVNIKPFLLPAYLVFSAIFILYVIYGYFSNIVYGTGFINGQNQALQAIINQANKGCETFTLGNPGAAQTQLINVACLQKPSAQAAQQAVQAPTESQ